MENKKTSKYTGKSNTVKLFLPVILLGIILGTTGVREASGATAVASATVGASDSSYGTIAWTIPAGSLTTASDANEASTARMRSNTSNYLVATGFGFAVPAGSTISGISARIQRRSDVAAMITDSRIRIVKGGVIGTTEKSTGATWPTTQAYTTFGGAADLWGTTWTAADVNAANFGIAIAVTAGGSNSYAYANHIEITVTYTPITVTVGGLASYPPPASVQQGDQNVAMLKFQLSAGTVGPVWTGGLLDKIGTNANVAHVTFDIYKDAANNGTFDVATDVKIGSGSFSAATGQAYTLTTSQTIATSTQWYFIIYNISNTATTATTVGVRIANNTYFTVTGGVVGAVTSTSSGTPTINAGTCVSAAPSVTFAPSSAQPVAPGKTASYMVTITNNDNYFCGTLNFAVAIADTGTTGSFNVPSTLTPSGACSMGYQGSCAKTLAVSAKTSAVDDDALTSTITVTEASQHTGKNGTGAATTTATDYRLHNSKTTQSSYQSSSWGITGGKYGKFTCDTCHTKTTTNIKRVKTGIGTPDATNWASSGTRTVTVNFQSVTTPNGLGDDTSLHTSSAKVCEVCHSQTSYHKYNQAAATHKNNSDCLSNCHGHNNGFKGDGPCKSCHNAAITEVYNTRQVSGAGGDFVRLSHHVNNGSTTEIVTDYDCIICHAEGDAAAAAAGTGYVNKMTHRNGTTSTTRMVKLRNVDNITQSYDWNKNAKTTTMRDNMDTFCMNCHDANGASQINVNGTNNGLNLDSTRALTPFNTNDTLRGNTADGASLGTFRSTTYGRVLNVKDQFNSGNATGKNWASHHNLNQFTKRYVTKNTTNWPTARLTAYVTREGKAMNGTANGDGETAGLHCSDCHLNETNAHGAVNSRYMLDGGTVNTTDDDIAWTGGDGGTHVCYKCHSSTVYTAGGAGTNQTFAHGDDDTHTLGEIGSPMGIVCFNCHGGYSSGSQGGLGAIHGTNETYTPGDSGTTSKRYRFMSGSIMRFYRPDAVATTNISDTNWEDASASNSCYTTAPDTWHVTTCNAHGAGRDTSAITGNRPLEQP